MSNVQSNTVEAIAIEPPTAQGVPRRGRGGDDEDEGEAARHVIPTRSPLVASPRHAEAYSPVGCRYIPSTAGGVAKKTETKPVQIHVTDQKTRRERETARKKKMQYRNTISAAHSPTPLNRPVHLVPGYDASMAINYSDDPLPTHPPRKPTIKIPSRFSLSRFADVGLVMALSRCPVYAEPGHTPNRQSRPPNPIIHQPTTNNNWIRVPFTA
ncbi:hypothetical protein COCC4DRAFT_27477 [Bipolaris maydis ATCC 48331]|uniref:Uncharacterized protein n=2 Tax=Cochliobolus heterostrophus TaxID=5016 RepID=M2V955_COCH5|nr:uncharacterized protein COCC4DRAFT_27477 [Bipolaris maydis ATCC 48331]EMD96502.1 hypothetical protein COCHEDRAFT_1025039 [Bipolaris maydis C5]ENI00670.1 hypothetical protein COCC4DRAFT_27477 [Bipolaris maydis ATCC 48331]KAJ6211154.1 hypothetical protein PSV09DRAFT_1025039 [Bipolaris maydis]